MKVIVITQSRIQIERNRWFQSKQVKSLDITFKDTWWISICSCFIDQWENPFRKVTRQYYKQLVVQLRTWKPNQRDSIEHSFLLFLNFVLSICKCLPTKKLCRVNKYLLQQTGYYKRCAGFIGRLMILPSPIRFHRRPPSPTPSTLWSVAYKWHTTYFFLYVCVHFYEKFSI